MELLITMERVRFMFSRCFALLVSLVVTVDLIGEEPHWKLSDSGDLPVIVLPESPSATESFAASELQGYLEQITSARLRKVTETDPLPARRIHVGRTRGAEPLLAQMDHPVETLRRETSLIDIRPSELFLIGGGDRGTLYAVYAFLELQGCRWIEPGPDGEIIPKRSHLLVPDSPVRQQPEFAVREIGRGASSPEEAEQVIDWSVKNRLNRNFNLRRYPAWHRRGGQVLWQHICHNSPWLLPNDPWFETHPEYFSLFNGRRIPQGKEGGYLCTTNPEVQRLVADYIINWFDQNPEGDAVPVSPPDGDVKWCECEKCMALGGVNFEPGPEGHMTRRQVEFVNVVARLVAEKHPDRYIVNLAYSRYVWPYAGMRTEPNVINQVAHGYAGNGSLVHAIDTDWNKEARAIFEAWAESGGDGIGIWDYFILHVPDQSGSPMTPLGFSRVADRMVDFLVAFPNPYKVYFTQAGDDLHQHNNFLYYFIARKIWSPEQTLKEIRFDYARHLFGDSAESAIAYFRLLDQAYSNAVWNPPIWREITVPSAKVFTPAMLEQGFDLLHTLKASLGPDAPALAHETANRMVQSLTYAETTVLPKQLVASDDGVWRIERGTNHYVFNPGAPEDHEETWNRIQNLALENDFMDASMERVLFRTRSREEPIVWLENDRLRLGVLPGVGGRLIRLYDRDHEENLFYEPLQRVTLQDPGATYFRYGGYEEYSRKDFASPGWELTMEATRKDTAEGEELILEGMTPEDILIRRRVQMEAGDSPWVHLQTTFTNLGEQAFPAMIRVHPEFQLSGELSQTALVWGADSELGELRPVTDVAAADLQPKDWWGLLDLETGRGLLNHYPSDQANAHTHLDRVFHTINLELFGKPQTLAQGESVSLEHSYQVISNANELPQGLRQRWEDASSHTEPSLTGLSSVPGVHGEGVRVTPRGTPRFRSLQAVLENEGSFAVWLALDKRPGEETDALIFSAGARQPDYVVLAIREGKLVFYRTQRREGPEVAYESWAKVDVGLDDWQPEEWHHVVVNWKRGDSSSSLVELFVDGLRVMSRRDVELLAFSQPMSLALGWDSSNASRPRFPGRFDQMRLFSSVLTETQVRKLYQQDNLQKVPAVLEYDFEEPQP